MPCTMIDRVVTTPAEPGRGQARQATRYLSCKKTISLLLTTVGLLSLAVRLSREYLPRSGRGSMTAIKAKKERTAARFDGQQGEGSTSSQTLQFIHNNEKTKLIKQQPKPKCAGRSVHLLSLHHDSPSNERSS